MRWIWKVSRRKKKGKFIYTVYEEKVSLMRKKKLQNGSTKQINKEGSNERQRRRRKKMCWWRQMRPKKRYRGSK
jgi:hypothetical protein